MKYSKKLIRKKLNQFCQLYTCYTYFNEIQLHGFHCNVELLKCK